MTPRMDTSTTSGLLTERRHPDLFTAEEALAYLHQDPAQERTLETLRNEYGLRGEKIGKSMVYHRDDLDALIVRIFGKKQQAVETAGPRLRMRV